MNKPIATIQTFQLPSLTWEIYDEQLSQALCCFPKVEGSDRMHRVKAKIECQWPSDEFFYLEFSDDTGVNVSGLYSYLTGYLLAVAVGSQLYVLDENELKLPKEWDGKIVTNINIGVSYTVLPVVEHFSIDHLKIAVKCLGRGYNKDDITWWKHSLSTIIFFTSESLRFRDLKEKVGHCFDGEYYTVSGDMHKQMNNWGTICKRIYKGVGWEGNTYKELIDKVSLMTIKDGTGGSPTLPVIRGSPTPGMNVEGRRSNFFQPQAQLKINLANIPVRPFNLLFGMSRNPLRRNEDWGRSALIPDGNATFTPR